jgi:hypothetical protein
MRSYSISVNYVCGQLSVSNMSFSGTSIVSFCFEFTCGLTKIRGSEGEPWHVGFVCHHIDVDNAEVLRRAAKARLGGNGKFADLNIVFVDQYDRSVSLSCRPSRGRKSTPRRSLRTSGITGRW